MDRLKLSRKRCKGLSDESQETKRTKLTTQDNIDIITINDNVRNNEITCVEKIKDFDPKDVEIKEETEEEQFKKCVSCDENIKKELYDDHWKICLQRFKRSNDESVKFECIICKKNLTHMNTQRRNQHTNKCTDEQEKIDNETKINYFLECFFCHKAISTEKRNAHVKQCARLHGANEAKLTEIVQLMEKQAEERRSYGFVLSNPNPKKNQIKPRNRIKSICKDDPDLQMALALSLSLKEEKERQDEKELIDLGMHIPKTSSLQSLRKNKKKLPTKVPLLLSRTPAEREKIITNKIALVLEDQTNESVTAFSIGDVIGRPYVNKSSFLPIKEESMLWRKAALTDELTQSSFYVSQFESIVTPTKIITGSKLKRMSQIPGRGSSQLPRKSTEVGCGLEISQQMDKSTRELKNFSFSGFFMDEVKEFSVHEAESINQLETDLAGMLANSELSDVVIQTKDNVDIHAHRFILYARCPALREILKEKLNNEKLFLDWSDFSWKEINIFLKFLYCARLSDGFEDVIKGLDCLATKFCVVQLKNCLELTEKTNIVKEDIDENNINTTQVLLSAEKIADTHLNVIEDIIELPECLSPELLPLDMDGDNDNKINDSIYDGGCSPIITSLSIERDISSKEQFSDDTISIEDNNDEDRNEFSKTSTPLRDVHHSIYKLKLNNVSSDSKQDQNDVIEINNSSALTDLVLKDKNEILNKSAEKSFNVQTESAANISNRSCNISTRNYYSQPEFGTYNDVDIWTDFDDNGFNEIEGIQQFPSSPVITSNQVASSPIKEKSPEKLTKLLDERMEKKSINSAKTDVKKSRAKTTQKGNKRINKIRKGVSASQPITPMPRYDEMDTPEIRNQLKKFGIRPMPRKKARKLLEHVYEETHPMVTDSECEESFKNTNQEIELNSSQTSTESSEGNELLEETFFLEPQVPPGERLSESLKQFIKDNSDIQRKILLYEPINIQELHNKIKCSGIRISLPILKEFLDKQCITFTMPRDRPFNRRTRKKNK